MADGEERGREEARESDCIRRRAIRCDAREAAAGEGAEELGHGAIRDIEYGNIKMIRSTFVFQREILFYVITGPDQTTERQAAP
jgi:hypothetical protein